MREHLETFPARQEELGVRMDALLTKEDLDIFAQKLEIRLSAQDKAIAPVIQALSTASGIRTFLVFLAPIAIIATIVSWFKT